MEYEIISQVPQSMHHDILDLIHLSFEEYENIGIHFTCSSYSLKDLYCKVLEDAAFFVCIAKDGKPIGITAVKYDPHKRSAYESITAILPERKGEGVGTALYKARTQYLHDVGCEYMIADTSIQATASVNWHKKVCCSSIIGLCSFENTNYYSYVLREDFVPIPWITKNIWYKIRFVLSVSICLLCKNKEGGYTTVGRIVKAIKKNN